MPVKNRAKLILGTLIAYTNALARILQGGIVGLVLATAGGWYDNCMGENLGMGIASVKKYANTQ